MSGTSMATPVVSGAFALVSEAHPGMSVADELALLRSTGPTVSTSAGPIPAVDLAAALDPSAAPTAVTATRTGQGAVDVAWAAPSSGTSGITGYTVTALPTGQTCSATGAATLTCSFSGLVDGPTYRFVVTPESSGSPGPSSPPSNPIVFGSTFHPTAPVRILDTRSSGANGRLGPLHPISLQVAGANGVPAGATAAVMNVTVTEETSAGYTVVYPSGRAVPTSSNLNYTAGQTVPNLVTVAIGPDGKVAFYNPFGATHVLVDLMGWYGGTSGAGFQPAATTRMLDTRYGIGGPVGAPSGSTPRTLVVGGAGPVPADASAVVMNVTVTDTTTGPGYLTVYPTGLTASTVSNLNYVRGETRANLVTVKLGAGGGVDFLNPFSTADVIADVVGYYLPGSGSQFYPVVPDRALDTRSGIGAPTAPLTSTAPLSVPIAGRSGVPATGATGVVMNVTAVSGTAAFGWLNVFPGLPEPYTSSLDYTAGQIVPNLVVVGLGGDGHVMISNSGGSVDVLSDVVGWFG